MIYEGDVLFFQCKMCLDRSTSMREIEDLILVFTDFYIAMLTS